MKFDFDCKKASEAAAKFLQMAGNSMNYMVLVKLLYLADRQALVRFERPITGDGLVSLRYGPVLSRILDLIRNGPIDEGDAPWFDSISAPEGYNVKLIGKPGTESLSGAEEAVLDEIFKQYGSKTWQELSRITHQLPEWVDPGSGSLPIAREQILLFEGRTLAEVAQIQAEMNALRQLDREVAKYEGREFKDVAALVR